MDTEIWRTVDAPFERYEVSNAGRVRNTVTGRYLSLKQGKLAGGVPGYVKVWLIAGELRRFVSVHRLVALAFIHGDSSLEVNHKDMDKANNQADNLEWVTHAENIMHGHCGKLEWAQALRGRVSKRRKPVESIDEGGNVIRWESYSEAGRFFERKGAAANIWWACETGGIAYGLHWRRVTHS